MSSLELIITEGCDKHEGWNRNVEMSVVFFNV
jgi:hypothetical protein